MPPLTDPLILAPFRKVLAEWNCTGYVTVKAAAQHWIASNLGETDSKDIAKAMFEFLQLGGVIDQVKETRPEWNNWPYHYDFRLPLAGRELYIETILLEDDPNDPTIEIVSIHDV
jgi:hypothetical protein